jgi:hypothetical protein
MSVSSGAVVIVIKHKAKYKFREAPMVMIYIINNKYLDNILTKVKYVTF